MTRPPSLPIRPSAPPNPLSPDDTHPGGCGRAIVTSPPLISPLIELEGFSFAPEAEENNRAFIAGEITIEESIAQRRIRECGGPLAHRGSGHLKSC